MWRQKRVLFTVTSTTHAQRGPGSGTRVPEAVWVRPQPLAQGAGHPRPLAPHHSPGSWCPVPERGGAEGAVAVPFGCAWSRKFTNSKLGSQSKPPQPRWLSPIVPLTATAPWAAKREALKTGLCLGCESTNVCPVCPAEKEHFFSLPNANSKDAPRFCFRLSTGNINKEEK